MRRRISGTALSISAAGAVVDVDEDTGRARAIERLLIGEESAS